MLGDAFRPISGCSTPYPVKLASGVLLAALSTSRLSKDVAVGPSFCRDRQDALLMAKFIMLQFGNEAHVRYCCKIIDLYLIHFLKNIREIYYLKI